MPNAVQPFNIGDYVEATAKPDVFPTGRVDTIFRQVGGDWVFTFEGSPSVYLAKCFRKIHEDVLDLDPFTWPSTKRHKSLNLNELSRDMRERALIVAKGATIVGVRKPTPKGLIEVTVIDRSDAFGDHTTVICETQAQKDAWRFEQRRLSALRNSSFGKFVGDDARNTAQMAEAVSKAYWYAIMTQPKSDFRNLRIPILPPGDSLDMPAQSFPSFVPPARPSAPQPEPDSPAVAALRPLLRDRQRVLKDAAHDVDQSQRQIDELEGEIAAARDELAYEETVVAAAKAELETVIAQIESLGGKVE